MPQYKEGSLTYTNNFLNTDLQYPQVVQSVIPSGAGFFFSWVYLQPRDKARALDPWSWSPLLTVEIHGNFRRLSSSESQSRCSNDASERKVFIVEQDIIHATTNARVRLPKHVGLVITIKHFAWSKQSITLHNRLGHYCSCDKTEGMETSIANETIAKTELTGGIIIPSNTTPGI